jgi:hypothetical protein
LTGFEIKSIFLIVVSLGTWKILYGTGKWKGIKGSGKHVHVQRVKPIKPGIFQGYARNTGTFELPK